MSNASYRGGRGGSAPGIPPTDWNQSSASSLVLGKLGAAGGVLAAGGAIIGLFALFGSWYTIAQYERGILLRNGAFQEIVQPGLHFKWPFIEAVVKADLQTHTARWGDKSAFEAYSADQQPANIVVSVTYRLSADKLGDFYNRFAGDFQNAVDRLVAPNVNKEVKVVFGTYTAARSVTQRGPLNADSAKAIQAAILYDPIFVVESVQIENIGFSREYIKSVEERMQAEVEVQRLKQNLDREKVQADIVITKATAQAEGVRQAAMAEADAIKLKGNAEAEAITARGKALAQNKELVNLVQAEKWDGKLPTTMLPGGAVPMLNVAR